MGRVPPSGFEKARSLEAVRSLAVSLDSLPASAVLIKASRCSATSGWRVAAFLTCSNVIPLGPAPTPFLHVARIRRKSLSVIAGAEGMEWVSSHWGGSVVLRGWRRRRALRISGELGLTGVLSRALARLPFFANPAALASFPASSGACLGPAGITWLGHHSTIKLWSLPPLSAPFNPTLSCLSLSPPSPPSALPSPPTTAGIRRLGQLHQALLASGGWDSSIKLCWHQAAGTAPSSSGGWDSTIKLWSLPKLGANAGRRGGGGGGGGDGSAGGDGSGGMGEDAGGEGEEEGGEAGGVEGVGQARKRVRTAAGAVEAEGLELTPDWTSLQKRTQNARRAWHGLLCATLLPLTPFCCLSPSLPSPLSIRLGPHPKGAHVLTPDLSLDAHTQCVAGVAWPAQGSSLFSVSWDHSLRAWDVDAASAVSVRVRGVRGLWGGGVTWAAAAVTVQTSAHPLLVVAAGGGGMASLVAVGGAHPTMLLWDMRAATEEGGGRREEGGGRREEGGGRREEGGGRREEGGGRREEGGGRREEGGGRREEGGGRREEGGGRREEGGGRREEGGGRREEGGGRREEGGGRREEGGGRREEGGGRREEGGGRREEGGGRREEGGGRREEGGGRREEGGGRREEGGGRREEGGGRREEGGGRREEGGGRREEGGGRREEEEEEGGGRREEGWLSWEHVLFPHRALSIDPAAGSHGLDLLPRMVTCG
ncbi:unnamed protein product [Closterium sp. Naga37s-1]|nr:unnamed protein product [Closterium sp. Naga37s-1]